MDNININIKSDIELTNYITPSGITVDNPELWAKKNWPTNEWVLDNNYDVTSETNSATTTVSGSISTQSMEATENRYLHFNTEAIFKGRKISTPWVTITQHKHPDSYQLKNLEIVTSLGTKGPGENNEITLDEMGEIFYVRASTMVNNDPSHVIVDEECYRIKFNGDCIYRQTKRPVETNDYIEWEIQLAQNTAEVERSLKIEVEFYYDDELIWGGEENPQILYIKQSKHTPVCEGFVFKADTNIIPASGAVVNIQSYYTRDGVFTALPEAFASNVFSSKMLEMETPQQNGEMRYTLTFKANPDAPTPTGAATRMMYWKTALNDKKFSILFIQQSEKQIGGELYFTDDPDTTDKVINTAYGPQQQTISFDITSLYRNKPNGIKISGDNYEMMFSESAYTNNTLVLTFKENTSYDVRSCKLRIQQKDVDNSNEITLTVRQGGKEYNATSDFDYMIINVGHDKLSMKSDVNVQMRCSGWAEDYNQFSCVGTEAYKYLGANVSKDLETTDSNYGDTTNSSLRWGGPNTSYGVESFVISPKEFLKNSVIKSNGQKEIVFDIYTLAKYTGSGLMTIKLKGYKSSANKNGPSTVPNPLSKENANIFTFQAGDTLTVDKLYHVSIPEQEGQYNVDYTGFIKVFSIKYDMEKYSWSYENLREYKILGTENSLSTITDHTPSTNVTYSQKLDISGTTDISASLLKYYNGYMDIIVYNSLRDNKPYTGNHSIWYTQNGSGVIQHNDSVTNDTAAILSTLVPIYDQTEYQYIQASICDKDKMPIASDFKKDNLELLDLGFADGKKVVLYFIKITQGEIFSERTYFLTRQVKEIYTPNYQNIFSSSYLPWDMPISGRCAITGIKEIGVEGEYYMSPSKTASYSRTMTITTNTEIPNFQTVKIKFLTMEYSLPDDKPKYFIKGVSSNNGEAPQTPLQMSSLDGYSWPINTNKTLLLYWGNNGQIKPIYTVNKNLRVVDYSETNYEDVSTMSWIIKGKFQYWSDSQRTLYEGNYTINLTNGLIGYQGDLTYQCDDSSIDFDGHANSYIMFTSANFSSLMQGDFDYTKTLFGFFDPSTKPGDIQIISSILRYPFPSLEKWYFNKQPGIAFGLSR